MARIFFTGGGTAGHVTPNIALIEAMQTRGWQCHYVGSRHGIERQLTADLELPFHAIHSGKLRRYFSWQNFIDPLFILLGFVQSLWLCLTIRPQLVFSKGGFVSVPVAAAAWLCRIPVISHESDITPGLANKLCLPFSRVLCVNFSETLNYLPPAARHKAEVTGSPLRSGLRDADPERGRAYLQFKADKPILLVVGGSLGARVLNETIWENLDWLTKDFQVVHLVGAGHTNDDMSNPEYRQVEYLSEEFGDVLACADVVMSRAGANSIYELLEFRKPHLLIPLSAAASRGDQLVNARVMAARGLSLSLTESELSADTLRQSLNILLHDEQMRANMAALPHQDPLSRIIQLIERHA